MEVQYPTDDGKKPSGLKKAFTSAVRRVSAIGVRRQSVKLGGSDAGSGKNLNAEARRESQRPKSWNPAATGAAVQQEEATRRNSSSTSWNAQVIATSGLYEKTEDEIFELSMDDDVLLPVKKSSGNKANVPALAVAEFYVIPSNSPARSANARPVSASRHYIQKSTDSIRSPEGARPASIGASPHLVVSAGSKHSLPKIRRTSRLADSDVSHRGSNLSQAEILAMPVSTEPLPITAAEAARTPRASQIFLSDDEVASLLIEQNSSLVGQPDAQTRSGPGTSSLAYYDENAAQSPRISPPVAPRDRRRSGMPDSFAIPLEHVVMAEAAEEGASITTAHAEVIEGDPKFEPYRDMLKVGASEIEVADAMRFFGINPVEFFGRDVLIEAGLSGEPTGDRKRGTLVWIEKKLEQDTKVEEEKKRATLVEQEKAMAAAAAAGKALPQPPPESEAYRAMREANEKLLSWQQQSTLASEPIVDQNTREAHALRAYRENTKEQATVQDAEAAKRLHEKEEEDRQATIAFARYQELQRKEEEEKKRKANEADRRKEDQRKQEEELARRRAQEEADRQAKKHSQRLDEEKQELERRHRTEEENRLKTLEVRIEKEQNKSATDPPSPLKAPIHQRPAPDEREAKSIGASSVGRSERDAKSIGGTSTSGREAASSSADALPLEEIEGNLLKKTKGGQWHLRAFTLKGKELSWVKSDQKTIAFVQLTKDAQVRDVAVGLKKFMFEISTPSHPPLMLSAAGAKEKSEWMRAIQYAITGVVPGPIVPRISVGSLQARGKFGALVNAPNGEKMVLGLVTKPSSTAVPAPPPRPLSEKLAQQQQQPPPSAFVAKPPPPPILTPAAPPLATPPRRDVPSVTSSAPAAVVVPTGLKTQQANDRLAEKLAKIPKPPQTLCSACGEVVYKMEEVSLKNQVLLHRRCFVCAHCKRQLTIANFVQHDGKLYCQNHYNEFFLEESPQQKVATPQPSAIVTSPAAPIPLPSVPERSADSSNANSVVDDLKKATSGRPRVDSSGLGGIITKKASFLMGGGNLGSNRRNTAPIDNSFALSKPIVPAGRRRVPSLHPTGAAKLQLGLEPQDKMTSDCTFKIVVDPSNPKDVLWMHATSRVERDHWVNCLCNVLQLLEMGRLLAEAQKVDMMSAVQAQADMESFLGKNECFYAGYCEKLSMKSHRNWKRRWFDLSNSGELKYSEDESKRAKHTIQLSSRSVVFDATDNRLSGPLALRN